MRVIMEPGDLFEDADGLIWVCSFPQEKGLPPRSVPESKEAQLVWFGPASRGLTPTTLVEWLEKNDLSHPEGDANVRIPLKILKQPFKLLLELSRGQS